jgi:nucleoside-diphosphate-sugar epimerase
VNGQDIACVTGASGMIGRQVVSQLLSKRYSVRVLTRRHQYNADGMNVFQGGLDDEEVVKAFLKGAHLLFHCAGELNDEMRMWDINVRGTERLLRLASQQDFEYLCYLSSAGVVGKTRLLWVDEETPCDPQNVYEKSKCAAEKIVAGGIEGCRVVILRPTNVIDEGDPGAFGFPMRNTWRDRLYIFLKGGECSHIVHAEDVASAALYFIDHPIESPQCFFVSCDHEPLNTFAGLWALYSAFLENHPLDSVHPVPHLPLIIPHTLRQLWRGGGNRGDVRYSANKLMSAGFKFRLGVAGAARKLFSHHSQEVI